MRKHHKQQLLELVKSLGDAHRELERLSKRGQQEAFVGLLADCQDSAQFIGEYIEQEAGEGTTAVAGLEHYCDLLFEASQAEKAERAGHIKKLEKQRVAIDKAIRQDLPAKSIEVLFMPYKASMWDSLESIWLAACQDPDCTPIVMPVPYYDMLPNGQKGQMQYDGPLFPPEVTVTPYSEYDIPGQHPDVIVIHNPYDGENLVTRLPEEYYSEHIREHTDLLVYSPYFVTPGESMQAHFAFLPGVRYADLIIAQSQTQRQFYIRYFKRFERQYNCAGRFGDIEKKCVALGSPKYDKVLQTKREDCELPNAWRKLVERPDGTRRKVILYNTTVADLLKGNDMQLKKLRYVLSQFKGRDDVVLWWRPHPLNAATCQAMRPQLYAEYMAIVREYIVEGWGIYDNTADLHRAMAVADAYYGDFSSLVPLFSATGKPVILQKLEIVTDEDRSNELTPSCLYDDGEYLWFSEYYYNALYRVKKDTWEAEYMGSFPGEAISGENLFSAIVGDEDTLWFVPYFAQGIAKYSITTGCFTCIPMEVPPEIAALTLHEKLTYYGGAIYQGWLYCTPMNSGIFMRFSLDRGSFEYCDELYHRRTRTGESAFYNGSCFFRPCTVDNRIFIASRQYSEVVELSMEDFSIICHSIGEGTSGYTGISYDGHQFLLTGVGDAAIYTWDGARAHKKIGDFPEAKNFPSQMDFASPVYFAGQTWLLPLYSRLTLVVPQAGRELSGENPVNSLEKGGPPSEQYLVTAACGDQLYAFDFISRRLVVLCGATEDLDCQVIRLSYPDATLLAPLQQDDRFSSLYRNTTFNQTHLYESHAWTLSRLMGSLPSDGADAGASTLGKQQREGFRRRISNSDGSSGRAIWAYCKERLH